jgi:hypothetical protein
VASVVTQEGDLRLCRSKRESGAELSCVLWRVRSLPVTLTVTDLEPARSPLPLPLPLPAPEPEPDPESDPVLVMVVIRVETVPVATVGLSFAPGAGLVVTAGL